jgi:hypothetical protein
MASAALARCAHGHRRARRAPAPRSGCDTIARAPRRLGLLALALGSGAVQVLAVPDPSALAGAPPPEDRAVAAGRGGAADAAGTGAAVPPAAAPLLAALQPAAEAPAGCLGASLPGALEWLPAPPHDLLLVRPGPAARVLQAARGREGPGAPRSGLHRWGRARGARIAGRAGSGGARRPAPGSAEVRRPPAGRTRHAPRAACCTRLQPTQDTHAAGPHMSHAWPGFRWPRQRGGTVGHGRVRSAARAGRRGWRAITSACAPTRGPGPRGALGVTGASPGTGRMLGRQRGGVAAGAGRARAARAAAPARALARGRGAAARGGLGAPGRGRGRGRRRRAPPPGRDRGPRQHGQILGPQARRRPRRASRRLHRPVSLALAGRACVRRAPRSGA